MAAPSVTTATPYSQGTADTSHVVSLPSGTAEKWVWIVTGPGSAHTLSATDWTVVSSTPTSTGRRGTFLRSDSATSATSVTITSTASVPACGVGGDTDGDLASLVAGTAATGTGTAPDPPDSGTLTSGDYRILIMCGWHDARRAVDTWPTGYADNNVNITTTGNNMPVGAIGSGGFTSITSEDPGAFGINAGSHNWMAQTIAIPEAAGGITGTASPTEGADTSTASGQLGYAGTAAPTEGADTSTATGTVIDPITGTASPTEGADTSTASGQLGYEGSAAPTEGADTSAASGTVNDPVTGTAAPTEGADTSDATGTVGGPITGTAAPTEGADTSAASGQLGYEGTAAPTEGADTSTATGQLGYAGTASPTEGADTSTASGQLGYEGTASPTEGADTSAASGTVINPITGTASPTEGGDTSSASGTVTDPFPGGLPAAAVIAIYDARTLGTGSVSAWPDSGPGSEDDLVQATGTKQPTITTSGFDGVKSVEFDGTDDFLTMTLAASYTGDFAILCAMEWVTVGGTDEVVYSTGSVPDKNILGQDPPNGWVVMSGDGTGPEHHTGSNDLTYFNDTPSRFMTTQIVENDNRLRLYENGTTAIDEAPASAGDLNNLGALFVGGREDDSRHGNVRIGYLMLVDLAQTDVTTVLAADDDLGTEFNVPGYGTSVIGSGSPTEGADTSAATGQLGYAGTAAVTEVGDTSTATGTVIDPVTGTASPTEGADTSAASGTVIDPITGTASPTEVGDIAAATGTVSGAGITGTATPSEAADFAVAVGLVYLGRIPGVGLSGASTAPLPPVVDDSDLVTVTVGATAKSKVGSTQELTDSE